MTVTSCRQASALERLACAAAGPGHVFTGQFAREATVGLLVIADLRGDRLFSFTVAPVDQTPSLVRSQGMVRQIAGALRSINPGWLTPRAGARWARAAGAAAAGGFRGPGGGTGPGRGGH